MSGKKECWRRRRKKRSSGKKKATSETKDYREMSCSPGSMNQRVAFFSNGKPRPEHSGLSITEIELPPYWLCTKQTISRMRAKCYSPYKPCCISSPCLRLLGAHWIIEDACMWVQSVVARGLQQTSLKVTFTETHQRPKHFPDLQSMQRVQEWTCHVCLIQMLPCCSAHVDTAQLFFFFFASEICFGVGPTFSSTITPAVLAQSDLGLWLLLAASLICPVYQMIWSWEKVYFFFLGNFSENTHWFSNILAKRFLQSKRG